MANRPDYPTTYTNVSLLSRVRDGSDEVAWRDFVDRYGPRIYHWCLHRKLQPCDAEDVTQNVLVKIARQMESFEYDATQTFRGWLRRITENAVIDFFRERRKCGIANDEVLALLDHSAARPELQERLEEVFDLELFEEAKLRVKSRIDARRWKAWELTAVEQRSGVAVAETLEMNIASVYSSRYQVQRMIADEVAKLDGRDVS